MVSTDVALLAEARVWRALVESDQQVMGREPSRVRELATLRLAYLEEQLGNVYDDGGPLAPGITDEEVDAAFEEAGNAVQDLLTLIDSVPGMGASQ